MVVWNLSNFGGLATIPRWQEFGWAVAPSHINLEDIMVQFNRLHSFLLGDVAGLNINKTGDNDSVGWGRTRAGRGGNGQAKGWGYEASR